MGIAERHLSVVVGILGKLDFSNLTRVTGLSLHSQAKLSAIARQLKGPGKTLLYQTPAEKFAECVAAIG